MTSYREMEPHECRERLEAMSGGVGLLAFCTATGPTIYPVNFTVDGEAVMFRTSPYTGLGSLGWGVDVAFMITHLDPAIEEGWSVLVKGFAEIVDNPVEHDRLRSLAREPRPWADGTRRMYVRVPWKELTGRILGAGWRAAPSPRPESRLR
jgi:nitroimidazol reductase NimA-like FMN-containing flavoprotein (pyridoxamine 5'-phosphate oxidase superfamily)